ncbi:MULTISPECIES: MFS transporter [unclassified Blastococcus]
MHRTREGTTTAAAAGAVVLPLALAQFIASYAASNMNVAISTIADDLDTDVAGIQTTITLFTLTMAALMIPGSKLTDIWGRKYCFVLGLVIYGAGALIAALAPGLAVLMVGYSLLEGVGSALLIPPIYILVTVLFDDMRTRAKWFGVVSAAAGLGAAAGPLIGGLITSAVSWRASFLLQVAVVALVAVLARRIDDPPLPAQRPHFDVLGAVLSAAGLFFVVFGILQTNTQGWTSARVWLLVALGVLVLAAFFVHARATEARGGTPLVSVRLFRSRTSNLGLTTQTVQWLVMQGSFFVISVFLQQERGYSAIQTGLMLVPATVGILLSSGMAQRMAGRHPQRVLIRGGFTLTVVGLALLLALVRVDSAIWTFWPGLFLMGFGVGAMLTASVNVVQSAWPEEVQGDISGVSRSVSNLGSSLGVAIAGSVLVVATAAGTAPFATAIVVVGAFAVVGWVAALLLPRTEREEVAA